MASSSAKRSKTGAHGGGGGAPTSEHAGFGKLILFGEHFVVYKVPALVGAVAASTTCVVELSDAEWSNGLILEDNRPAVPGYKVKKCDEMLGGTRLVLEHFGIDTAKRGAKVGRHDATPRRHDATAPRRASPPSPGLTSPTAPTVTSRR